MEQTEFPNMCDYLSPVEGRDFKITHKLLTKGEIAFHTLCDNIKRRREHMGQEPGTIVQLRDKHGTLMMSDSEMERRTNRDLLWKANGDVLIAGLGLGMVLLPVQAKQEVNTITVVEIHQEIIDMIVPRLPLNGKVTAICGDIFEWYPPPGVKYDTIYFDIWNDLCTDDYQDRKRLHRRFGRRLNRSNPKCWISSWRYEELKDKVRRERSQCLY